jgi:hypothetical protein
MEGLGTCSIRVLSHCIRRVRQSVHALIKAFAPAPSTDTTAELSRNSRSLDFASLFAESLAAEVVIAEINFSKSWVMLC